MCVFVYDTSMNTHIAVVVVVVEEERRTGSRAVLCGSGKHEGEEREDNNMEAMATVGLWPLSKGVGWGEGRSSPHFILHRVWQLLATAAPAATGSRLIRTSNTLFALLKVINHVDRGLMVPAVQHHSSVCILVWSTHAHTHTNTHTY